MSGSTAVAMEKPTRARMPEEYVFMGASMKAPMAANSMMPGVISSMSRWSMPMSAPARAMFSRPERSGSKPACRLSNVET